jgi:hypothetical protein
MVYRPFDLLKDEGGACPFATRPHRDKQKKGGHEASELAFLQCGELIFEHLPVCEQLPSRTTSPETPTSKPMGRQIPAAPMQARSHSRSSARISSRQIRSRKAQPWPIRSAPHFGSTIRSCP